MQKSRFAICGKDSCGKEWQLEKPIEEYTDGPRCPECGSRRVEIEGEERNDRPTSAVVFEALERGQSIVEIVQQEGIAPDEVERLAEKFEQLSEYEMLDQSEITEIRRDAFQRGKEKGSEEGYTEGRQDGIQKGKEVARSQWVGPARERAYRRGHFDGYQAGYEDGEVEGYSDGMNECDDRIEEVRSEVEQEKEQIEAKYEEKIETARNDGFEEGKELAFEKARQDGYQTGYEAAVDHAENEQFAAAYAEGVRHGVIIGEQNAAEEGKIEGMARAFKAMYNS